MYMVHIYMYSFYSKYWCNILKTLLQKGPWSAVAEIRAEFKYLQTFATLQVIKRHVLCIVPQCFQLLLVPPLPPSPPPLSAHALSVFFCLRIHYCHHFHKHKEGREGGRRRKIVGYFGGGWWGLGFESASLYLYDRNNLLSLFYNYLIGFCSLLRWKLAVSPIFYWVLNI